MSSSLLLRQGATAFVLSAQFASGSSKRSCRHWRDSSCRRHGCFPLAGRPAAVGAGAGYFRAGGNSWHSIHLGTRCVWRSHYLDGSDRRAPSPRIRRLESGRARGGLRANSERGHDRRQSLQCIPGRGRCCRTSCARRRSHFVFPQQLPCASAFRIYSWKQEDCAAARGTAYFHSRSTARRECAFGVSQAWCAAVFGHLHRHGRGESRCGSSRRNSGSVDLCRVMLRGGASIR